MQDLHYVVHVLLIDSFLAPRGNVFPREPLDQLEISALTECELKRFSRAFRAGAPSLLACLPRSRAVLSFAHYFQAPATQAMKNQTFRSEVRGISRSATNLSGI